MSDPLVVTAPLPKALTPINDSLERQIGGMVERVPAGKTVQITSAISTTGFEVGAGVKRRWGTGDITAGGYASRLWGAPGWRAGARASIAW